MNFVRILFDVPFRSGYTDDGKIRFSPISAPASRGGVAIGGKSPVSADYEFFGAAVSGDSERGLDAKAEVDARVDELRSEILGGQTAGRVAQWKYTLMKGRHPGRTGNRKVNFVFVDAGEGSAQIRLRVLAGGKVREYECKIVVNVDDQNPLFRLEVVDPVDGRSPLGEMRIAEQKGTLETLRANVGAGNHKLVGAIREGERIANWEIELNKGFRRR